MVNVHALIATGINADGYREILGVDVSTAGDGAGWLTFWRSLTARGLSGVKLVTSDAHAGLVAAIGATLPGAAWQRCRTHYTTNLMAITPKASWPWVRTLLHSVFDQPDAESVDAQYDRVIEALADKLPKVADHLEAARADLLAFTAFPKAIWRQIWSNNPRSGSTKRSAAAPTLSASSRPQLPDPPRRRSPGRTTRRMGRVRRYLGLEVLSKSRADHSSPTEQEATPAARPPDPTVEESRDELVHHALDLTPTPPPTRQPDPPTTPVKPPDDYQTATAATGPELRKRRSRRKNRCCCRSWKRRT